ncbi:MAG: hypothetical protein LBU73_06640 [Helicobacteraceae bacterium]|jgi:hypothetical protein|nr:hypothetical protein [Helicobacteraceae bacterium]
MIPPALTSSGNIALACNNVGDQDININIYNGVTETGIMHQIEKQFKVAKILIEDDREKIDRFLNILKNFNLSMVTEEKP